MQFEFVLLDLLCSYHGQLGMLQSTEIVHIKTSRIAVAKCSIKFIFHRALLFLASLEFLSRSTDLYIYSDVNDECLLQMTLRSHHDCFCRLIGYSTWDAFGQNNTGMEHFVLTSSSLVVIY
jgi:hypothetical protein